jgi:hypothetical protein
VKGAVPLIAWAVTVVATGVNDVVDQIPAHRAVAMREVLADGLHNALGVAHVIFVPLPLVRRCPGPPQPLRRIAGTDAERHDRALARRAAADGIVRDLAPTLWPAIGRAEPSAQAGAAASRRGRSRRR